MVRPCYQEIDGQDYSALNPDNQLWLRPRHWLNCIILDHRLPGEVGAWICHRGCHHSCYSFQEAVAIDDHKHETLYKCEELTPPGLK